MQENTFFSVLNEVNCNEHVEKKGNLSSLLAWEWQMVKLFTDGKTYWDKADRRRRDGLWSRGAFARVGSGERSEPDSEARLLPASSRL